MKRAFIGHVTQRFYPPIWNSCNMNMNVCAVSMVASRYWHHLHTESVPLKKNEIPLLYNPRVCLTPKDTQMRGSHILRLFFFWGGKKSSNSPQTALSTATVVNTRQRSNRTTPAPRLVGCGRACKLLQTAKGSTTESCPVKRAYQTS
jgi:hypothetical protein